MGGSKGQQHSTSGFPQRFLSFCSETETIAHCRKLHQHSGDCQTLDALWFWKSEVVLKYLEMKNVFLVHIQGGGGRFKDRKPIGEVCCRDAWVPERTQWWIDRLLRLWVSLYLSLSVSFSLCLCLSLCVFLVLFLSLSPSLSLSLSLYICLPVYLFIYLDPSLSISLSIPLSLSI